MELIAYLRSLCNNENTFLAENLKACYIQSVCKKYEKLFFLSRYLAIRKYENHNYSSKCIYFSINF